MTFESGLQPFPVAHSMTAYPETFGETKSRTFLQVKGNHLLRSLAVSSGERGISYRLKALSARGVVKEAGEPLRRAGEAPT
jgi:hypothetical protein